MPPAACRIAADKPLPPVLLFSPPSLFSASDPAATFTIRAVLMLDGPGLIPFSEVYRRVSY
jgi:hypothetical protein